VFVLAASDELRPRNPQTGSEIPALAGSSVASSHRPRSETKPRLAITRAQAFSLVLLAVILLAAACFRFYGQDWDRGYLFHPDERKIVLVVAGLHWPSNASDLFSPDSPLSPQFFAYGSFPIYLLKVLYGLAPAAPSPFTVPWGDPNLVPLALMGRTLSSLFDLGTIVLIFLLARQLFASRAGLIASACCAVTVQQIQLSHYYTVDTVLTFFVVATVLFAARLADAHRRRDAICMAVAFGLAMATKVSAAPLVVPIAFAVVKAVGDVTLTSPLPKGRGILRLSWLSKWLMPVWQVRKTLAKVFAVALGVFIVTQPYVLIDPIQYFGQVGTESLVARGWLDYPYTRQFADTVPFLYQIWQSSVWGMSLPLGILAWGGAALFAWQAWQSRTWRDGFILSWALVYFVIIGGQYAKYPRYLLPLLPFLFLMAAVAVSRIAGRAARASLYVLVAAAICAASVYAVAFTSIYVGEHPWLQISDWIYQHIPPGSAIANEHWDDVLPLSLRTAGDEHNPTDYKMQTLPMYDTDNPAKLTTIVDTLTTSDYIILASPRLYATISRLPQRYPIASRYYRLLFQGQLGFELVAFARDDPRLGSLTLIDDSVGSAGLELPALLSAYDRGAGVWDWGRADESYTVYDHPMPLVFKKTHALGRDELSALLAPPK
jgi:hypothetical protein